MASTIVVPSYGEYVTHEDIRAIATAAKNDIDNTDTTAGTVNTHLTSAQNVVPIPLGSFWEVDGTALAAFADAASPTPGLALDNSEAAGIRWNDHATPSPITASVVLPMDLDDAADIVVHVFASKSGTTATAGDLTTFTITAFFQTVGALSDADADAGGATDVVTAGTAKAVREVTLAIDSADVPAAPCVLTLTIQPTDSLLTTDDVTMHAIWLEYTSKLLTA